MLYILGHSHAINPILALSQDSMGLDHANWREQGAELQPLTLKSQWNIPGGVQYLIMNPAHNMNAAYANEQGQITLSANYIALLKTIVNAPASRIACFIQGNEHSALSMIEHAVPYDFMRPGDPPPETKTPIIPIQFIRRIVRQASLEFMAMSEAIRVMVPEAQLYFFAPPPPIPSKAQIISRPEVFGEILKTHDITAASVRLKFYDEYVAMMREHAQRMNAHLVEAPPEARDAKGFLREECWQAATHGNMQYAEKVAAQLGDIGR